MLWSTVANSVVDSTAIAVLYPEVRAPYDRIFNDIIKGVEQSSAVKVETYALQPGDEQQKIATWLQQSGLTTVISLGNQAKAITGSLPDDFNVIIGASILSDDSVAQGHIGISLSPAPGKMFAKLKELAPSVKVVNVIYHPQTNQWLMELAERSAKELNLQLVTIPATDAREGARFYKKLLERDVQGKSAIWLLQNDPTLDERSLLPIILSQAWNKNHVIFSNNPSHVKRGALFSLFPDNIRMGISLSAKARQAIKGRNRDIDPLEDLLIAVNIRTAEHLALKISRTQARKFNLVFPII
jgi:putative ABC transport system substrate-binding protein